MVQDDDEAQTSARGADSAGVGISYRERIVREKLVGKGAPARWFVEPDFGAQSACERESAK